MPTLVVPANVPPCQVDDFPDEVAETEGKGKDAKTTRRKFKRGVRTKGRGEKAKSFPVVGALFVRPASSLLVTDDELNYLKEKHPALLKRLIVHKDRKLSTSEEKEAARKKSKEKEEKDPPPGGGNDGGNDDDEDVVAEVVAPPAPKPSRPRGRSGR